MSGTDGRRNIERILRTLTEDIGVRLAGSDADRRTIDFVRSELADSVAKVVVEEFPVRERHVTAERLEVEYSGGWEEHGCSLFSNAPGTDGKPIEAPLCFFEAPAEYHSADFSRLAGKAVVHLGCHIESREHYRKLIEAKPAFLLMVDTRYPGTVPLADGMFPSYVESVGAVPTVNVAYMDAWRWQVEGAETARLAVSGGMRESSSANVIAEIPGTDESAGMLIVSGHHDTQANSPGADDNGTGTAAVIELARVLGKRGPFRRTIRLISFGAEEQLSVGSAAYVRSHRDEMARSTRLVLNFDACGSHFGWFELTTNGPREMAGHLQRFYADRGLHMRVTTEAVPYSDHFPFVAAGVPAAYIGRSNCAGGRFFHHRTDDDITRVSVDLLASLFEASAILLEELANANVLPFSKAIPEDQQQRVEAFWQDLFGGW